MNILMYFNRSKKNIGSERKTEPQRKTKIAIKTQYKVQRVQRKNRDSVT